MAEEPKKEMPIPWIATEEGILDVYSNFNHVNWSVFDVRIRFGQIIPDPSKPPETATWVIEERAAMTLAWGQAKGLRDMLSEAIRRYEDLNGEIQVPKLPA